MTNNNLNTWNLKIPRIEITELTRNHVHFVLRNKDASFANALRRVMIAEVPTLAIELVTIYENTSVLHDEFLAHRFGLLPIDSNRVRDFKYKKEQTRHVFICVCVNKNIADNPMPVPRLEDLTMQNGHPIEVAKLTRNQRLNCQLIAVKGIGKLHAKWSPVSNAVFQYEPEITINEKLLETVPLPIQQKIADSCHKKVFTCEGDAFTPSALTLSNIDACDFTDEIINVTRELGYQDLIKISHKPDVFKFIVESTGALSPEQIVDMAFEVLEGKTETLLIESSKLERFQVDDITTRIQDDRHSRTSQKENFILNLM